jgi:hypothetical protein
MTEESTPAEELTEVIEVTEELEAEPEEVAAAEETVSVVPDSKAESRGKKSKVAPAPVEVEAAELQEVVEVVAPAPAVTPAASTPATKSGGMSISIRNRR